ncbi:MAG TPA: hypothetical protein ENK53_05220, partial [Thiotrichales bacterium]|nr:hypothetical protein [Thiotrichales bacterium]
MESTIRGRQPWLLHFLALLLVLFLLPVHAPRGAQTPPKFLELDARQARLFSQLEEWLSADELERLIQDAEPFTVLVATRDPMSASALRLAMNLVSGLKLSEFEVRVLKNISRRRGRTLAIVRTHGMPSVALANVLRKSDLFDEVSLDMHVQIASVTPSDPLFDDLWGLHNEGQQGGQPDADIDAPEAWDITTGNGESIIAIIDSGIHYRHPDLADNIWTNPGEICDNGIDDDDNGYVDDCHGIDVVNDDGDPLDDNGHGTHVAGTIAAVANNGIGIAGINWNAKLLGCKFITAEGGGALSGAIECLDYLIGLRERGINIVASNNSWGSPFRVPILEEAIRASVDAGIAFITAAGNYGVDIESAGFYPCSFPVDGLICVAATDREDRLADFSSRGAVSVDVAAPGDGILSTVPEVEMIPLDRFREDAEGGGLRWKTYSSNGVNWHRSLLESRSPTHSWAAGDADGRLVPGQVS